MIDNFDATATPEQDEVQLHVNSFDSLIVLANSIDLWILDTEKHHALVLKKVLSTESKAYGHLEINLDDGTRTLRITVENMIEKLKQPASANSPIPVGEKNKILVDGIVKELEAKILDSSVSTQGEMDPNIIRQVNYLINMTASYASNSIEQTSLPLRSEPAILIAS